ncbi:uncharacterized protein LOC103705755 isoform X2 [Phoenix dactylifera]|uniref:Uncharacterized protein LOC103705755 isoform X2 n=1 Tax=Phoenix dactylifera TaxID=42345 RepID=A0A8B9ARG4_PHODC|nr:uncharacterized protein LOC103705755 isoform X2 [Phoenix dactylifera]
MDFCLPAAAYVPGSGSSIRVRRCMSNKKNREICETKNILCLASKRRGFGTEPMKKEKNNDTKKLKESMPSSSESSKSFSGKPKSRIQRAPQLTSGMDLKSSDAVFDRQFLEKVETVRRSALEQKKAEEDKLNQAIDYDAPIESEQNTIGLGTKLGVGAAVLVFGLVFAFGDFLPYGSVGPSEDAPVVEKKLTEKQKATLETKLQEYEAMLGKSPEDPTALEGATVTLVELGKYERASSLLDKLTKERPNNADAYRLLGEVKYELKDYEGSASAYRSSLSASNGIDFEVLRGLTNSLLAAKRPNEAVQILLSSREQLNRESFKGSDISVDANGNLEKKTQKIDPIQVDLLLGKAYSDWGHISDAVAVYDQLISEHPNDFRGYLAKGIILKENGKVGDAERMFIQARFFAPDNAKALVDQYSRK